MEIYNAKVIELDSEYSLSFNINDETYSIPLTKDEPNEVKGVFNQLIIHLKKGSFNFNMEEKEDSYVIYHVAKEYIDQLNAELDAIYEELKVHKLIDESQIEDSALV